MDISKELLRKLYLEENHSMSQIGEILNVSKNVVKRKLRKYGLRKTQLKLGNEHYDNKEWLYNEYVVKKKGYTIIARELGVSSTVIRNRILYFGWPVRGHAEIDKGAPRRGVTHSSEAIDKIKNSRQKKRITCVCNYCSSQLEVVHSKFKYNNKNYCNAYCFREFLKENRVECMDITNSAEYKEWRKLVYIRDGYRCKMPGCNSTSRQIAAHHIYPKKKYPDKQFDLSNGITLCRQCHEKTYGKEQQFIDMLVRVIQK
ncbi:HNH endonuclease [Priestia flexa]|uniref:HNH endonuclease n=1 Tax=Priestia flexa TaxID=86664 RepID=UPI0009ED2F9C|nr:HNH endonuclease [Priestia flexa]MCM3066644.1 HNH endonuclease [Priestia flexa]MCP1190577.1 HNH endonuclease [Priestia flexa]MED3822472.1 HNH endonuclease [Priestia flexa]MED4588342.1 HNH endonuclease [Priestia flexa]